MRRRWHLCTVTATPVVFHWRIVLVWILDAAASDCPGAIIRMGFIMRILKNGKAWAGLSALICVLWAMSAHADFEITATEAFVDDGLLQVDSSANLVMPAEPQQALDSGVDLRIQFLIELSRSRNWIWDTQVENWDMLFTLHFHQLSGQYILATPQSDTIQAFNTVEQALTALASQLSFNLGYQDALKQEQTLYLRTRIRLDTEFLPAPLRLFSLVSSDWKLDSGWKVWELSQ